MTNYFYSRTHNELGMRPTLWLIGLTLVYLLLELGFNARLLDMVGGLDTDGIHELERFGRLLSGTAVALFVLQYFMTKRQKNGYGLNALGMTVVCLISIALTYGALKLLIDTLTERSSPEFRKAAANLVAVRSELISGQAVLEGLSTDPMLYSKPEGKAFVALFPALGALIWPTMDKVLEPIKLQLLERSLDTNIGGAAAFYKGGYADAMSAARRMYAGRPNKKEFQELVDEESNAAWDKYLRDLRKEGKTPEGLNYREQKYVSRKMEKEIGVFRDWHPANRQGFNDAIAKRVEKRLNQSTGAVYDGTTRVASNLSFEAYVRHHITQKQLRAHMDLPSNVTVQPEYSSGAEFERTLYQPMLAHHAKKELVHLNRPAHDYSASGSRAEQGLAAAEKVLIAPIALLFSLMGALAHMSKLLYQLVRLGMLWLEPKRFEALYEGGWKEKVFKLLPPPEAIRWLPKLAALSLFVVLAVFIASSKTPVTDSVARTFFTEVAYEEMEKSKSGLASVRLMLWGMHMTEIGQSLGYPINNFIRTKLLLGFEFGSLQ